MNITWPTNTVEIIDAIRGTIGRDITFMREVSIPCSACAIDPITNTSTNSFCVTCSGVGYIITYSGVTVSAHVIHNPEETMRWSAGGQYIEGDVRVQVKYTVANLDVIDNAEHVLVDGKKFDVRSVIFRGVKELNRILIDLIQRKE